MPEPMSDERLAEIRNAFSPASIYASGVAGDGVITMGNELLAEVERLRSQLAECGDVAENIISGTHVCVLPRRHAGAHRDSAGTWWKHLAPRFLGFSDESNGTAP